MKPLATVSDFPSRQSLLPFPMTGFGRKLQQHCERRLEFFLLSLPVGNEIIGYRFSAGSRSNTVSASSQSTFLPLPMIACHWQRSVIQHGMKLPSAKDEVAGQLYSKGMKLVSARSCNITVSA
uniref:Uncharacterized protein n=1 Tax=Nelumbo nucifera TaxID=4432 RepID=A0A822YW35_NELNU|nr:TPA_asm: hypothetical protein HUJ06_005983 [Nelumbo nucifera]DAD35345.1 TPA_asm: hypothetical protein HUJ06_005985 [Nelumbo nucifera]